MSATYASLIIEGPFEGQACQASVQVGWISGFDGTGLLLQAVASVDNVECMKKTVIIVMVMV